MKKIIIILVVSIGFFYSCKKKEEHIYDFGEASATRNGEVWNAKVVCDNRNPNFLLSMSRGENRYTGTLHISNFEPVLERQQLVKYLSSGIGSGPEGRLCNSRFISMLDDQSCDRFDLLEADSANNYIRITRQENNYDEIWGEFSATYIRTGVTCNSEEFADTLIFRDGTFHFKGLNE